MNPEFNGLNQQRVGKAAVDLLADLVAVDSVNPGLVPGAKGESRIVEFLRERLDRAGFETHVVLAHGDESRPSLVALGPGSDAAPVVAFNGHLDTVGVKGMDAPFSPRVDGTRLYGRGAADMKGGVAAMVVAAEELVAGARVVHDASMRPLLTLVADEEDASVGSESVIAALPELGIHPSVCIIGEPTDLAVARSLRGFAVVRVTFAGRAAHTSQPENGVNAVSHLAQFMARVETRASEVRAIGGDLMITVVRGGDSPFVIPDHAECIVELRTVAGRADQVAGHAAAIDAELFDSSWDARAELVAHRESWQLDARGRAADLARTLGAHLGTGPTFDAPYWMEAPLWQAVCPTLICGPSGGGLHAVDEWVDLDQVRAFSGALVRACRNIDEGVSRSLLT